MQQVVLLAFFLTLATLAAALRAPVPMSIRSRRQMTRCFAKITPKGDGDMESYRQAVLNTLKEESIDRSGAKLGGRELLDLIIKKWGVAYDLQLRKNTPFGEGSENIYINVMWRYFGQKSFPMDEREYLEHLEAIGRYITSIGASTGCFRMRLLPLSHLPSSFDAPVRPWQTRWPSSRISSKNRGSDQTATLGAPHPGPRPAYPPSPPPHLLSFFHTRPHASTSYAVSIPLNVDPSTADKFFKDLPYE